MDAETCSSCSAKVRSAGTGLKSYLSSGKSSAMAISLRPISFHCDTTACDALGAALGPSLLAFAKNCEAQPTSSITATHEIAFFIFFSPYRYYLKLHPGTSLVLTHQLPQGLSIKLRTITGHSGVSYYSRKTGRSHKLCSAAW